VIPAMRMLRARRALFLDVGDLAIGGDFPVAARHAAAPERRESEETDKTHHANPHPTTSKFCTAEVHALRTRARLTGAYNDPGFSRTVPTAHHESAAA
jgi:hypothetical protein